MAVWTKKSQIVKTVVVVDAVDMIEMENESLSEPCVDAAYGTLVNKETATYKAFS